MPAPAIASWLAISLITVPCGFLFGLTRACDAEKRRGPSGFMLFGSTTLPALMLSSLVNAVLVGLFLVVPSGVLLNLFDLVPFSGGDRYAWAGSLLGGAAIGKTVRWWRWKKNHHYL